MASIYQVSKRYRAELLAGESGVASDLVRAYARNKEDIQRQLAPVAKEIADAHKAGKPIKRSAIDKEERFQKLLKDIEEQIGRFAYEAEELIASGQGSAVEMALKHAKGLAQNQLAQSASIDGTWNRVPIESVEHLVGRLGDGSPLKTLLDELGPDASAEAKDVLTKAVAQGLNPRQTAKQMDEALSGNRSRALTIARTEQLRAYRSASVDSYQANSDILDGWTRIETLDDLTCVICIVEHGKIYPLQDDFETHPNCRGTSIPNVIGAERNIQTGEQWFEGKDAEYQKEALGDAKYEAWSKGDVQLQDYVARTESPDWGGGRREVSLEDAKQIASKIGT